MNVEEYFAPGYHSIDDVEEQHGEFWDATTLQKVADCPRKHEVRVEMNLDKAGPPSAPMVAGIAFHAGLEHYYSVEKDPEDPYANGLAEVAAIQRMYDEWERFNLDRAMMDMKHTHLSPEHLEQILSNYFLYWGIEEFDIYTPITSYSVHEELDLSDVLAARFAYTEKGKLILGESSLVMKFDVGGESLVYSGKPDLPCTKQNGSVWIMDHKTSSSFLSDYWSENFALSNQLRGYMAMMRSLLGKTPSGAVINGVYVGKYATNPNSKAVKFKRYQYNFVPAHIDESLRNQLAWKKTIEHYRKEGYWPQGCAYGGCDMPQGCKGDPDTRAEHFATHYEQSTRKFWEL